VGGVSGSSVSTGSFGRVEVAGDLSVTGTAPGWQLISSSVPSGTPDELKVTLSTSTQEHRIVLTGMECATDDSQFKMQVGYGGVSDTWLAGTTYIFGEVSVSSDESENKHGLNGTDLVLLTEHATGNAANEGVHFLDMKLKTSHQINNRMAGLWQLNSVSTIGEVFITHGAFNCDTGGNTIDKVRFFWQLDRLFQDVGKVFYYTLVEA
jgi:hypothetical protein